MGYTNRESNISLLFTVTKTGLTPHISYGILIQ